MNGDMIKSFIIFIILAACLQTASAMPPIPESYWGYATLNGAPAPIGTSVTVEVYDTGEIIGSMMEMYSNSKESVTTTRMGAGVLFITDIIITNRSNCEDYLGVFA